jgi:hypothetical protein
MNLQKVRKFFIIFEEVGFFGLPKYTTEKEMTNLLSEHGKLEKFIFVSEKKVYFVFF